MRVCSAALEVQAFRRPSFAAFIIAAISALGLAEPDVTFWKVVIAIVWLIASTTAGSEWRSYRSPSIVLTAFAPVMTVPSGRWMGPVAFTR